MNWDIILSELTFRTSRSSGAGGQHVQKTETRVEVILHIASSKGLTEQEKALLTERLQSRMTDDGYISVVSQKERSQLLNKETAIEHLRKKLEKGVIPLKRRLATRPSREAKEERLEQKRKKSEVKKWRNKPIP